MGLPRQSCCLVGESSGRNHDAASYPEFDTFGMVMPAYGIYARHVRGINMKNVRNDLLNPDARLAKVFINVEGVASSLNGS